MNKILLISLIFLLAFSLAANELVFGIKGGLNLGFFSTNEIGNGLDDYYESDLGMPFTSKIEGGVAGHLGVFLIIPLSNKLSFQTELIYKVTESSVVSSSSYYYGYDINYTEKYRYLEFPLLLNVDVIDYFSLYGGGFLQYLIGAECESSSNRGIYEYEREIDNYYLNEFTYGLSAGIDYTTPLRKSTWIADLRCNYQLKPFIRNTDITPAIISVDFSIGIGF